jgi:hypothetical protein
VNFRILLFADHSGAAPAVCRESRSAGADSPEMKGSALCTVIFPLVRIQEITTMPITVQWWLNHIRQANASEFPEQSAIAGQ